MVKRSLAAAAAARVAGLDLGFLPGAGGKSAREMLQGGLEKLIENELVAAAKRLVERLQDRAIDAEHQRREDESFLHFLTGYRAFARSAPA